MPRLASTRRTVSSRPNGGSGSRRGVAGSASGSPSGGDDEERQPRRLGGEEVDELADLGAAAVDVVEEQHEGPAGHRLLAEAARDVAVEAEAVAVVGLGGSLGGRPFGRHRLDRQRHAAGGGGLEEGGERPVALGRGAADPHPRPVDRRPQPQLAQQPALAHPLVAFDHQHGAAAAGGVGEGPAQAPEHRLAGDQPRRQQGALAEEVRRVDRPAGGAAERRQELRRRGEAAVGLGLDQPRDDRRQLRRHVRPRGERVGPRLAEVEGEGGAVAAGGRQLAGGQLVEGEAEGVEVGAVIVGVLHQHLGGGVGEGAADRPAHRRLAAGAGEAEVEDAQPRRPVARRQAEVGRLDVEVEHAVTVDVRQPRRRLHGEVGEEVPVARLAEEVGDRPLGEELHGEEGLAAGQHAGVVDGDDVRVPGLREQPHLVAESRQLLRVPRVPRHLERQRLGMRPGAHAVDDGERRLRDHLLDEEVPEQPLERSQGLGQGAGDHVGHGAGSPPAAG